MKRRLLLPILLLITMFAMILPAAPAAAATIDTVSLPAGVIGTPYSQTLTASGGTAPYTWAVTAGFLPSGLALDPATGTISGTPDLAGSTFTVQVTDAVMATAVQDLTILMSTPALAGGTLDPTTITKYAAPLVIPPEMPMTSTNATEDYYEIAVRQLQQQILPAPLPSTTVWSYASVQNPGTLNYPAFTIEATAGKSTVVKWINDLIDQATGNYLPHLLPIDQTLHWANPPGGLAGRDTMGTDPAPYTGPVPIVTHVHGAHTTEDSDGWPEAWYLPAANNIPAGYATVGSAYDIFAAKAAAQGRIWQPGSALYAYPNDQRATTLWYHDHSLGMTRTNVYIGPAGFYLLRGGPDDLDMGFNRPGLTLNQGINPAQPITEIPIVVQDRSFNSDGSLFYPDNRAFFEGVPPADLQIPFIPGTTLGGQASDISAIWNPEFFGNTLVTNGTTWPNLQVEQRQYRFRLLNGAQSRFFIFKLDNGMPFTLIGTEGGFLPSPVSMTEILLGPAERADVIVDFTGVPAGTNIIMQNIGPDEPFGGGVPGIDFPMADTNTTGQVMRFQVVAATGADLSTPVASLVLPAFTPLGAPTNTQYVSLNEEMSASLWVTVDPVTGVISEAASTTPGAFLFGPMAALLGTVDPISGTPTALRWMAPISEKPAQGATEMFEIHNFTADAHPIHIHLVQFQVIERVDGLGVVRGPEVWETGYKDTVISYPGEITRLKARFDLAGLFVWHCHILEHEDNEMMRPYMTYAVPVVNPFAGATINAGGLYATTGTFSSPGLSGWTATVDYGDGSGVQPLTIAPSSITFNLNHIYATAGMYTVTVTVTDSSAGSGSNTAMVNVNVGPVPLTVATTTMPAGTVGTAYSQTLAAVGGTPPYTWSISAGALPGGLTLDGATGIISGTPTTAEVANFTVMVTDSVMAMATQALSITINPVSTALTVTTTTLPDTFVGSAYGQMLAASGGTPPYTWAITAGALPAGLTLNPSNGSISGSATTAGVSNFTVMVMDSMMGMAMQNLSITVNVAPPPLAITTTSLAAGTVGVAYSQTLAATGGAPPYTWSISAGTLPAGLMLNPGTGVISGSPTTPGTSNFVVMIMDSAMAMASTPLSITVNAAPTVLAVSTTTLPNGTVGTAYNQTLAAVGGTAPYTWSISAGALPGGLTLDGATGVISGTPTTAEVASFTVQVMDSVMAMATQALSITISAAQPASASLSIGWNTLATPIKLDATVDTWGEMAIANALNFTAAYKWNGTSFAWVNAVDAIVPLDAIYVNMNAAGTVTFLPFTGISNPPTKNLIAGWNLVGSAFLTPTMPVNEALISAYFATGGLWGYSQVVSPTGVNQTSWIYVRDGAAPIPLMEIGKGYWVFMTNPATLAGFTSTP